MGLKINHNLVNNDTANTLVALCPFKAITYENFKLEINAACKNCKMCVRQGPAGVITFEEDSVKQVNKEEYKGICVYADLEYGSIHKVTFELLGKARQLADQINHPVYALLIGNNVDCFTEDLLAYGADKVYVYDHSLLKDFDMERYTNCFEDFVNRVKPSSVLVGATNVGRSLAPRVAARFHTGLTADCTKLEIKDNTDLVQIRPAFGGNIMAQIVNPNHRPQFATVRYKIFDIPEKTDSPKGSIEKIEVKDEWLKSRTQIISVEEKPKDLDISEADVIVAIGRGIKDKEDIEIFKELADLLGGVLACSRPMVENGFFDAKHQIGLSGKSVKPKLIITAGISGAIQFTSGMSNSDTIIAINSDPDAQIFAVANYAVVGDMYKIVPELIRMIKEERKDV